MTTTTDPATTTEDTTMTDTLTTDPTTAPEETASTPSTDPPRRTSRVRHSGAGRPLTEAEAEALAARMPDDPVTLDPDDLACGECGRVVAGPLNIDAVRWDDPSTAELPGGALSASGHVLSAEPLTSCPTCAARLTLAHDLAARLLPSGLSIGGVHYRGEHVASLVAASLSVLAALGVRTPGPALLTRDVLILMVRRLAPVGSGLRWAERFAPVRLSDARPGTANQRPWAHVRESGRHNLRRAYVELMADRLSLSAPPVALTPPPLPPSGSVPVPSGCLLCGVASVTRPAVAVARDGGREHAARSVWTYRSSVGPDTLGGRAAPTRLAGHTCPVCTEAVAHVGAMGATAMERALMVALDLSRKWAEGADALVGLVGWGGLYADAARRDSSTPAPNPTPWEHVGDLDKLRDRIASDLGGAR